MRILKSDEWKFEGTERGYFKFSDRREALEGGTLLLTRSAKYVNSEFDIVLMLEWKKKWGKSVPSISFTHDSRRRILNKQFTGSIEQLTGYMLNFKRLGLEVGPLLLSVEA